MRFDAQKFLSAALPTLQFADQSPIVLILGAILIEPISDRRVVVRAKTHEGSSSTEVDVVEAPSAPICIMADDLTRFLKVLSGEVSMASKIEKKSKSSSVEAFDGVAELKCGNVKSSIPALDPKHFVYGDDLTDELSFCASVLELRESLFSVINVAGDDEFRPQLSGLTFHGNKLSVYSGKGTNSGASHKLPFLVDRSFVLKMSAKNRIMSALAVSHQDSEVVFCASERNEVTAKIGDTVFNFIGNTPFRPKWCDELLGSWAGQEKSAMKVNAQLLKTAVGRASIFGPQYITLDVLDSGILKATGVSPDTSKQVSDSINITHVVVVGEAKPPYLLETKQFMAGISLFEGDIQVEFTSKKGLLLREDTTTFFQMQSVV